MIVAEFCSSWALIVDMIVVIGVVRKISVVNGGSIFIINVGIIRFGTVRSGIIVRFNVSVRCISNIRIAIIIVSMMIFRCTVLLFL